MFHLICFGLLPAPNQRNVLIFCIEIEMLALGPKKKKKELDFQLLVYMFGALFIIFLVPKINRELNKHFNWQNIGII